MTSYVYIDLEVKLTGRKAVKKSKSRSGNENTTILHEITPLSLEDGSWKKWIEMSELYPIIEEDNNP